MAEFIFRDFVRSRGLGEQFYIESAATSREEIGHGVYPPAKRELKKHGLRCDGKTARQITKQDYDDFDFLIAMENYNIRNMERFYPTDPEKKIFRFLDFGEHPRDIADPWYSGDFTATYEDIVEGCEAFLQYLFDENKIVL